MARRQIPVAENIDALLVEQETALAALVAADVELMDGANVHIMPDREFTK
eukprot:gene281-489_t